VKASLYVLTCFSRFGPGNSWLSGSTRASFFEHGNVIPYILYIMSFKVESECDA